MEEFPLRLPQSDVLAPLDVIGALINIFKPLEHHGNMVPRALRAPALDWAHYACRTDYIGNPTGGIFVEILFFAFASFR